MIETPKGAYPEINMHNAISDSFCDAQDRAYGGSGAASYLNRGGNTAMGEAIGRGMVLAFSIWMDASSHMLWLDGTYPVDADPSKPGNTKGPCSATSGAPEDITKNDPNAYVSFSNIKVGPINSTKASLYQ